VARNPSGIQRRVRQIDDKFKERLLKSAILNRMTRLGTLDGFKLTG
jgi:hypothetical protein